MHGTPERLLTCPLSPKVNFLIDSVKARSLEDEKNRKFIIPAVRPVRRLSVVSQKIYTPMGLRISSLLFSFSELVAG
ncbi:hypothetical protein QCA50_010170 [Cerrena zonata]|uniref:Uncharacterized protein n=1 Tax=Cerrena zonata TaxID=2478898 RepID=A0AAW0G5Z4_9APHY